MRTMRFILSYLRLCGMGGNWVGGNWVGGLLGVTEWVDELGSAMAGITRWVDCVEWVVTGWVDY